ncbi:MAG: flagellar filament capping protein FliD [Demequinaceae bacterium]|nr:flagellar filament capping protein FliD [Demequinaceae bacterium]
MSSTMGIDGLVSGLNTTDLINNLMSIESGPQTLLKAKQSTAQDISTALQGINTRIRSFSAAAEKAATAANWTSFKATSSSSSVAASTTTAAKAGSITFAVDAVANRQVSLTAAVTDGTQLTADNPPTLTIKKADGSLVTFTAASNSLSDIASAITGSAAGVSATAVRVNSGSPASYRLQFTAGTTGTDGAFEVYVGDGAAVTGMTATRLDTAVATTATNAQITLWKGTGYEQSFTQSSNTFTGLMTGVDVTVSQPTASGETVTVDVATDATQVSNLAKNLVGTLAVVLSDIDSRTATTMATNADGSTSIKGGLLTGDNSTSQFRSQLMQAATYPVNGVSPSSVGIILGKDGSVTFDADKFAAALAKDPAGTATFVQTLSQRVQDTADLISDPYDGALSSRIKSQDSLVKQYGTQIEGWDTRLALRRSTLQSTYSALEVTLSNLNAQSSWLTSQLASLPTTA